MEIDGWIVKIDAQGNYLRMSRERPKTHYIITLLKNFAIDIELLKEEVDAIPEKDRHSVLMQTMRKSIKESGNRMPFETTFDRES